MIELFVGKIGGGKTYNAVYRMINYLASGGVVCTNIVLDINELKSFLLDEYGYFFQEKQYIYLPEHEVLNFYKFTPQGSFESPTLIIIDEAHLYFNSRSWASASKDLLCFITQSRKCHTDIIFITQHENTLDKQLRIQALFRWTFKDLKNFSFFGIKFPFKHTVALQFSAETSCTKPLKWRYVPRKNRLFKIYKTDQLLREFPRLDKIEVVKKKRKFSKKDFRHLMYTSVSVIIIICYFVHKYILVPLPVLSEKIEDKSMRLSVKVPLVTRENLIGFFSSSCFSGFVTDKDVYIKNRYYFGKGRLFDFDDDSAFFKDENKSSVIKFTTP